MVKLDAIKLAGLSFDRNKKNSHNNTSVIQPLVV